MVSSLSFMSCPFLVYNYHYTPIPAGDSPGVSFPAYH
nr:MAG TPA: hypothetical protein [Caudoviricetes sp.]